MIKFPMLVLFHIFDTTTPGNIILPPLFQDKTCHNKNRLVIHYRGHSVKLFYST